MEKIFKDSVFNVTKFNFIPKFGGKKSSFSSVVFNGSKEIVSKTKFGGWNVGCEDLFSRKSFGTMVWSADRGWYEVGNDKLIKGNRKIREKSEDTLKELRRFVAGYLSEGDGVTLFSLKRFQVKKLIEEAIKKDSENVKNPFLLECVLKCAIYEFTRESDEEPWKTVVPGMKLFVQIFVEHGFYEYVFSVMEKKGLGGSAMESLKKSYAKIVISYVNAAFLKITDRDSLNLLNFEAIEDYFLKELEKKIKGSQVQGFLGIKGVFSMMLMEAVKYYSILSDDKNWQMIEALLGVFMEDAEKNSITPLLSENSVAVSHILDGMRIQSGLDK